MRLVFAGTPDPAVPSLSALARSSHEIATVITRPDAPRGRKRVLTPSPVAAAAQELGIDTLKTARLDEDATARISEVGPDLGVIVAYGGLVREPLLSVPAHGWINLHFSLLPRWRGAAPVQHALIAGDRVTGAAVFRLVAALDAGDVFAQREVPVHPEETAGELLHRLAEHGAELLLEVVDEIAAGNALARPQTGEPTLAPKLTIDDGRIRWEEPTGRVLDRIRGTTPEPGAHTTVDGARLKVLRAEAVHDVGHLEPGQVVWADKRVLVGTRDGAIALLEVQPAGRGAMSAADWWRGLRRDELRVDS
ncbi:methionyl-tRNA formyltransferase [Microbacterium aquimaris]|uniref:Methionyl-tRNA formyltransferase n=1 Tax=Microbacterium aquimaris TaxID=459816 RepID=A0ABU5N8H2_9MICO|nr:methionyl-tRNA formyltransferase [Microbacterium aquimaris]MDZ8162400.1 methionyl-tRNA formyltransferase [Microbacterium aquimaris]